MKSQIEEAAPSLGKDVEILGVYYFDVHDVIANVNRTHDTISNACVLHLVQTLVTNQSKTSSEPKRTTDAPDTAADKLDKVTNKPDTAADTSGTVESEEDVPSLSTKDGGPTAPKGVLVWRCDFGANQQVLYDCAIVNSAVDLEGPLEWKKDCLPVDVQKFIADQISRQGLSESHPNP